MLGIGHVLAILVISASVITILSVSADQTIIPPWIKKNADSWVNGYINDQQFITSLEWMLENNLIKIESVEQELQKEVKKLSDDNQRIRDKNAELCDLYILEYNQNNRWENPEDFRFCERTPQLSTISQECFGDARCFTGKVTKIIDGDTIEVDHKSIRLAVINTPEKDERGYDDAKDFVESLCPINTEALVDEDDKQTEGSYGRIIGVVYCNDVNLNEKILRAGIGTITPYFCSNSEFANQKWLHGYGC